MGDLSAGPAPSSKRSVKASKLAKMSEQDRARYLEKRLAEEEESKRRKEEMINAFLRLKLGHEEKAFFLNNSKLIDHWRLILRQCKNEDLRVDVKMLADSFARALDKKTSHIDLLLQELTEEEQQYGLAFRSQLELINQMDRLYTGRMMEVLSRHHNNMSQVIRSNASEGASVQDDRHEQSLLLGDVLIATNQRHQAIVDGLRTAFQDNKEDIRNKSLEERQALQILLEEVLEGLWRKLHDAAVSHKSNTEEKRRVYQEFMSRDKKGLAEVVENNKRILKLTEDVVKLKETLNEMSDLENRRLSGLRKEKEELFAKLHSRRRTVSVRHAKQENKQVIAISVRVDKLQKVVGEAKSFQSKVLSAIRAFQRGQQTSLSSLAATSDSGLNLELAMLREERVQLNRRLRILKARLGSDLAGVRRELQS